MSPTLAPTAAPSLTPAPVQNDLLETGFDTMGTLPSPTAPLPASTAAAPESAGGTPAPSGGFDASSKSIVLHFFSLCHLLFFLFLCVIFFSDSERNFIITLEKYFHRWWLCTPPLELGHLAQQVAWRLHVGLTDMNVLLCSAGCLSTAATRSSLLSLCAFLTRRFSSICNFFCLSCCLSSHLLHSAGFLLASNLHSVSSTSRCTVACALWERGARGWWVEFPPSVFACWGVLDLWWLSPAWDESYFIVVCTAHY